MFAVLFRRYSYKDSSKTGKEKYRSSFCGLCPLQDPHEPLENLWRLKNDWQDSDGLWWIVAWRSAHLLNLLLESVVKRISFDQ